MTLNIVLKNTLREKTSMQTETETEVKRTKSGRLVKPPERYTPIEQVEDDYDTDDYDSDEDEDEDYESSDDEEDDESDSEGSLKDFVVPDEEDSESDSES